MRKAALVAVLMVLMVGVVVLRGNTFSFAADAADTQPQPKVTVWPSLVNLDTKTSVVIMGSGFPGGQQLHLIMPDGLGGTTDLLEFVLPKPQPGDGIPVGKQGDFACLLVLGNQARVQVEGVTAITVTDAGYKALATAPIGFADPSGTSRIGVYPTGKPDYTKNPNDPRPLPWTAPFFEYPKRTK